VGSFHSQDHLTLNDPGGLKPELGPDLQLEIYDSPHLWILCQSCWAGV